MPVQDDAVTIAVAALNATRGALLVDLELTCWEDSLRSRWADPTRPAEVIEIGLAAYRIDTRAVTGSFASLVRRGDEILASEPQAFAEHVAERPPHAASVPRARQKASVGREARPVRRAERATAKREIAA